MLKLYRRQHFVIIRKKVRLFSRKAFGSFHSEDIEHLISVNDASYEVPPVHIEMQHRIEEKSHELNKNGLTLGRDMRDKLFCLDGSVTFINHGAFGAVAEPLLYEAQLWHYLCESQPLKFFDRLLFPLIAMNIRNVAKYINCSPQNLLPLPNVTHGLNILFNSMSIQSNDEIIYYSLTYGSTKKMLMDLSRRTKCKLKMVHIPLGNITEELVNSETKKALSSHTKLIVIDHITSNTALEMPVERLGRLVKTYNSDITVVIDAAHSLFSQTMSINGSSTGASSNTSNLHSFCDYWITNTHKWLCNNKGCAYLWVNPKQMGKVRPLVVSHGFSQSADTVYPTSGKLLSSFAWDGCRDYSSILTSTSAINLWNNLPNNSYKKCRKYMQILLLQAAEVMYDAWNVPAHERMVASKELTTASPMILIPIPKSYYANDVSTDDDAYKLQEILHHKYNIEVPIKSLEGKLYCRISAHVYNTIEEYVHFANIIKKKEL